MWKIDWKESAIKDLRKINQADQSSILKFLDAIILENPRSDGGPLIGNLRGFWRYRVKNYRIICVIKDEVLEIQVVAACHRKDAHK